MNHDEKTRGRSSELSCPTSEQVPDDRKRQRGDPTRPPCVPQPDFEQVLPPTVSGNGLQVTTFQTPVAGPPTLDCVENDGHHVKEAQALVGSVDAPFDRKGILELYGIDLRYAIHNSKTGRWERCLFSYPLADMLELLSAEGDFPFAFEAVPSQGEVDWADLKARGQKTRPMMPLRAYLVASTPESRAAVADDERMRARRGTPEEAPGGGEGTSRP